MNDSDLAQFINITGADSTQAKHLLEASGGNVEQAIQLYFSGVSESSQPAQPQQQSNEPNISQGEEEEVREPIPQTAQTLVGGGGGGISPPTIGGNSGIAQDFPQNLLNSLPPEMQAMVTGVQGSGASSRGTGRTQRRSTSPRSQRRRDQFDALFKPPTDIIFNGTMDAAMEEARKQGKWLLINIQDESNFDSLQLNRDLWSNEGIKDLVNALSIFWQEDRKNSEGQRACTFYDIEEFPTIGLINPKTGEISLKWTGSVTLAEFNDKLMSHVERYPLEVDNPTESQSSQPMSQSSDFSNDEMAEAISASLQESQSSKSQEIETNQNQEHSNIEKQSQENVKSPRVDHTQYLGNKSDSGITRLQLRFPNGGKEVICLKTEAPLAALYDLFESKVEEAKESKFEVIFGGKTVEPDEKRTLADAGISRAALSIRFL
eukprot:gb/GECH01012558.1/.p1 GENE.gb/GECH01012558.1/~~gb/GECH01012558.1/.p1  ORF type:complete len:433 (+),score=119.25 gb/GECH01012558.1/:1-1299(+)